MRLQNVIYGYIRCLITRDTYWETRDPARLPAQLARRWGQKNWNCVWWGKNILYWVAKAEQKSLVRARKAQQTQPRRDPFHLYSLIPHLTSVSTVSRGHRSVLYLLITKETDSQSHAYKKILLIPLFFIFWMQREHWNSHSLSKWLYHEHDCCWWFCSCCYCYYNCCSRCCSSCCWWFFWRETICFKVWLIRCCYITVDSEMPALWNGACT